MSILNAHTVIPAERTIAEIQVMLRRVRAKAVLIEYDDDGNPATVAFRLITPIGERDFSLPCRWQEVQKRLKEDPPTPSGKLNAKEALTPKHARNVAWRIVKDWLEVQLAIIESSMVTADEVFLPYMLVAPGRTMYQGFTQKQLQVKD